MMAMTAPRLAAIAGRPLEEFAERPPDPPDPPGGGEDGGGSAAALPPKCPVTPLGHRNGVFHYLSPAGQLRGLAGLLGLLGRDPQVFLQAAPSEGGELTAEQVESLISERAAAKAQKDYTAADRIRADLLSVGVVLEDGAGGTRWRRA